MYHCQVKAGAKGKGASATKHAEYIMREGDYKNHDDLEHVGYGNMPSFANTNAGEIWRLSDKYEGANRTVYRELELGFPLETGKQDRIDMVEKLMSEKFKGHAFTYAIHDKEGNPHAHVMLCDRKQDGIERTAEQFFMRANKKNPEKGGCAKAEELNGKDRGNHVEKIRKSWADRHNDFYKSIGSEERADHRTLVAQRDSFLEEAKQLAAFDKELAAEATKKAALLDRPADKRISRKEWHRLQKSGELEQIKEERAANRELAESKAQIIDLQAEKKNREPTPQDIVVSPRPSKSAPVSWPEVKIEKKQDVIQTPDTTRRGDPDQLQEKPVNTTSSELSEALPLGNKPSVQQPVVEPEIRSVPSETIVVDSPAPALTAEDLRRIAGINREIAKLNRMDISPIEYDRFYDRHTSEIKAIWNNAPGIRITIEDRPCPVEVNGQPITEMVKALPPEPKPSLAQTPGITRTGGRK